jgi:transcriptional regulator with XRE-family HTH domain
LLLRAFVDTAPGKVIRSLRQALDMTQAEFARAAGWSASTISSWERGTAKPSRVAFKTILAFAEERGVRYTEGGATATNDDAASGNLPVLRLKSRVEPPIEVLDAGRGSPLGSFGSRRWTEVAASRPAVFAGQTVPLAERPEWQIDARLQIRVGKGGERWRRTGYVAASLIALAIGAGAGVLIRTGLHGNATPATNVAEPAVAPEAPAEAIAPEPAVEVDKLAVDVNELALAAVGAPPYAAGEPAAAPAAAVASMPAPAFARLESIVVLDGVKRATFRVGDRSIALVEGDQLGGRTVVAIANRDVELAGGGVQRRVRLGSETPLQ